MRRGTRVGQAYVAVTADGSGINEALVDAVDDAGDDIEKSGSEHGDRYGENFSDGALDRIRDNLAKGMAHWGLDKHGSEAGDRLGNAMVDRLRVRLDGAHDLVESLTRRMLEADDKDIPLLAALTHGLRSAQNEATILERQLRALMKSEGMLGDGVSGNAGPGRGRDRDTLGDMIGRMFGAGSRNNALNLLGKSMGGMINLLTKGVSLASAFASNMSKAGEGASIMSRVMAGFGGSGGGIGGMFAKIGVSAPMAVAGIAAVMFSMSAMVSVVGALLALLTAMASTITSALVGALAVLGAAIGAVVVAGGLLTAAFTSMTNAQIDYLNRAFQPVKAAMTGIGQIIMTEFVKPLYAGRSAIQVWSANIQRAMLPLAGVAATTARAFAEAGNTITAALAGPGFQRFFNSLGSELPKIVRSLSVALGGFMNGLAGMFAAIMPYVTQFSAHLAKVAASFSNWANSAKGQNSITEFVGRAVESLKSLWEFVKQVGGFIADVFFNPVSQAAGKTIFDKLADTFEGFRRKFNKAVKDGSVQRWFSDAIKFAGQFWAVMEALGGTFMALYNSGVLTALGGGFGALAMVIDAGNVVLGPMVNFLGRVLPPLLAGLLSPIVGVAAAFLSLGEVIEYIGSVLGIGNGSEGILKPFQDAQDLLTQLASFSFSGNNGIIGPIAPGFPGGLPLASDFQLPQFTLPGLISSGNTALNNTYESHGGYMPDPTDASGNAVKHHGAPDGEWVNPAKDWAISMMAQAAKLADEIRASGQEARKTIRDAVTESAAGFRKLMDDLGKVFVTGVGEAAKTTDVNSLISSFQSLLDSASEQAAAAMTGANANAQATLASAYASRDQMIASAQAARESALQAVASASNDKELRAAKKLLKQADDDLALAYRQGEKVVADAQAAAANMIANAEASNSGIQAAAAILAGQASLSWANVSNLVAGLGAENATLADYAEARRQVGERLEAATQGLVDAIGVRDSYFSAVKDSVLQFGSLLTAQAKTINGVQQALTFDDITTNMRDRLAKVKKFQEDLRLLLSMGLSDSAYKQLVDAGVDTGGAYAQAILDGGQGAVSEVNNLTAQFEAAGQSLGATAANHLYQAGVDAAKGLVDGLTSLSAELDAAAVKLGESIAAAVKRSLGIASPSRVLRAMMGDVGDGAVLGLDDQHAKVGLAASRLAGQIAVSPEVAAYASQQGTPATVSGEDVVSGNGTDQRFRDLIIQTPTEDPHAVAMETLNEITGRL